MTWRKTAPWLLVWGAATKLLFDWLAANEQPAGQPELPLAIGSAAAGLVLVLLAAYAVHSKR